MYRLIAVAVLAWWTLPVAAQDKNDAVKKELEKLRGEWKLISGAGPGTVLKEEDLAGRKFIITGDVYEYVSPSDFEKEKGKLTLNPAASPAHIDLEITEGDSKGRKQIGIYELKDNRLKFCIAFPGQTTRPTKFTLAPEDRFLLYEFERVKK